MSLEDFKAKMQNSLYYLINTAVFHTLYNIRSNRFTKLELHIYQITAESNTCYKSQVEVLIRCFLDWYVSGGCYEEVIGTEFLLMDNIPLRAYSLLAFAALIENHDKSKSPCNSSVWCRLNRSQTSLCVHSSSEFVCWKWKKMFKFFFWNSDTCLKKNSTTISAIF